MSGVHHGKFKIKVENVNEDTFLRLLREKARVKKEKYFEKKMFVFGRLKTMMKHVVTKHRKSLDVLEASGPCH